jgi:hypothetical protein
MLGERAEYNGEQLIVLKRDEDDRFPFQFGIKKAKLILDHIDDIKDFVEELA